MPKTKAQLEQELQEARETIERYYNQILELQKAAAVGIEADPRFKQAQQDAEAARQERDLYKGLYNELAEKTRKRPMGRPVTISDAIRAEVLSLHAGGASVRAIAEQTGVSRSSVQRICSGGGRT